MSPILQPSTLTTASEMQSYFPYSDSDIECLGPRPLPKGQPENQHTLSDSDMSLPTLDEILAGQTASQSKPPIATPEDAPKAMHRKPPPKPKASGSRPRGGKKTPVAQAIGSSAQGSKSQPHVNVKRKPIAQPRAARPPHAHTRQQITPAQELDPLMTDDEKLVAITNFFETCKHLVCGATWIQEDGQVARCTGGHIGVSMARQGPYAGSLFIGCSQYRLGPPKIHLVHDFPNRFPIYAFTQAMLEWSPNFFSQIAVLTPLARTCLATAHAAVANA